MRVLLLLCLSLPALCDEIRSQVIGGSDADIANYPYQLSLRVSDSHYCGASLISSTKAVCAAHCAGEALSSYSLLAGTTDRTVTTCATCEVRTLISFPRNSDFLYNGTLGYPNDVSAAGFDAIGTNSNIGYVAMASQSDGDYAGHNCVITGWGKTCRLPLVCGILPLRGILQKGNMTVITKANCVAEWGAKSINDGHICVSSPSVSACSGDSGGPLVCGNTLVGATSWGEASCDPKYPSVYTRISYFRTWIDDNGNV